MKPAPLILLLLLPLLAAPANAGDVPRGKPEDAGMSSLRLRRIHEAIQPHIDADRIQAPHGKEAIFRIVSMSKPITGVAVMMLVEEGKLRLNDGLGARMYRVPAKTSPRSCSVRRRQMTATGRRLPALATARPIKQNEAPELIRC